MSSSALARIAFAETRLRHVPVQLVRASRAVLLSLLTGADNGCAVRATGCGGVPSFDSFRHRRHLLSPHKRQEGFQVNRRNS